MKEDGLAVPGEADELNKSALRLNLALIDAEKGHGASSAPFPGDQPAAAQHNLIPAGAPSLTDTAFLLATEEGLVKLHGRGVPFRRLSSTTSQKPNPCAPQILEARLLAWPLLSWLRGYSLSSLVADCVAGLTTSAVLVPQAVAYAMLADLPPVYGLYCSLVPLVVFACFTRSAHCCVGPFALMSLIVGALVKEVVPPDVYGMEAYIHAVLLLSVLSGAMQVAMGCLGLGVLATFMSDPSTAGFTCAGAIVIATSQLKHVLGVPVSGGSVVQTWVATLRIVLAGRANPWAAGVTAAAICLMHGMKVLGRRLCARVPLFEQLVALVVFSVVCWAVDAELPRVGDGDPLPPGLPAFRVPRLPPSAAHASALVQAAATCAFTGFLLTMSIVRTMAARGGVEADGDAELIALGLANVLGGFFGAYPAASSLSRSALVFSVGGRTPLHGVVQAAVIAVVLVALTGLFEPLPYAVLAAVIFMALTSLVDFTVPARLWRTSRPDAYLWLAAFCSTILLGVQPGLVVAIGSSLGALVWTASRPRWAVLGRLPGTDLFRDVTRYPLADSPPGTLIFAFDAPLNFANAHFFASALRARVRRVGARRGSGTLSSSGVAAECGASKLHTVVLDCSSVHSIDSSAEKVLRTVLLELREAGVRTLLAASHAPLREALEAHGTLPDVIPPHRLFVSIKAAVEHGCSASRPASPRTTARMRTLADAHPSSPRTPGYLPHSPDSPPPATPTSLPPAPPDFSPPSRSRSPASPTFGISSTV